MPLTAVISPFCELCGVLSKIVHLLYLPDDGVVGGYPVEGVQVSDRTPAKSVVLAHSKSRHALFVQARPAMAEVEFQRYLEIGIDMVVRSEMALDDNLHLHLFPNLAVKRVFRLLAGLNLPARELPFESRVRILGLPALHTEDSPLVDDNSGNYMVVHGETRIMH